VALHRYLRLRLADYDYEKHMGGYLYLFVRGVRPGWGDPSHMAGVHARRPDYALVTALDALMDGGAR
jgi:exodeoxyribonuclease V beta subunit